MTDITTQEQQAPSTDLQAYTVDALINRMSVKANATMWKSLDPIIRVQGTVGKIKTYGKTSYFDLRGSGSQIKIQSETALSPKEGEYVIIEGSASFNPAKFHVGLEVAIIGVPVSQIEIKEVEIDTPPENLDKPRYLRLSDYIYDHGIYDLHFLGTETAIRDVLSHLDGDIGESINCQKVTVSNKDDVIKKIKAISPDAGAIAIVRGGDDITLEIWNDREVIEALIQTDIPFYLALGHTHGITLAARYADETFHTPTSFGSIIRSILAQMQREYAVYQQEETFLKQQKMFTEREQSFLHQEKAFKNQEKLFLDSQKAFKEKEALLQRNLHEKDDLIQSVTNSKDLEVKQKSQEFLKEKLLPYKIAIGVLVILMFIITKT